MENQQKQPGQVTLTKPVFIGLVVVIGLLFLGICYLLLQRATPPNDPAPLVTQGGTGNQPSGTQQEPTAKIINGASITPVPTKAVTTPEDVSMAFYNWYFSYKGDPLLSGAYKKSEYLTPGFKDFMADSVKEYNGTNDDPMFCTKNKTSQYNVLYEPAIITNNTGALVKVRRIDDARYLYYVRLELVKGKWLINDIICQLNG